MSPLNAADNLGSFPADARSIAKSPVMIRQMALVPGRQTDRNHDHWFIIGVETPKEP